jgi:hypothetical protein
MVISYDGGSQSLCVPLHVVPEAKSDNSEFLRPTLPMAGPALQLRSEPEPGFDSDPQTMPFGLTFGVSDNKPDVMDISAAQYDPVSQVLRWRITPEQETLWFGVPQGTNPKTSNWECTYNSDGCLDGDTYTTIDYTD